ncbi:hypothetical protein ECC02_003117 [Trypanosoma cruzi]|uniref:Uncharacterized protein n=1 Tax=Trypanosoma cruzi TaxID=5693 RepID=A0A7J6YAS8_TRYCR|nr:hypothetical protein ECC02_003117 [Trypanosoma cruzi]
MGKTSARAAAGREAIRTCPRHPQHPHHPPACMTPPSRPQHVDKTHRGLPSTLLARAAADRILCFRASSANKSLHSVSDTECVCACACVFGSAYNCRAAVRHKRVRRKQRQREADRTHANYSYHHTQTHTRSPRNGCSQPQNNEKQNKKPKRGTTSAHTLIAPVKQNTHTGREKERSPTQCNKNKTETVTVLRPCSQAGRQRCVSCKREHQRACMGVHAYIQWAHYVCASWDEVRARVHARGHTQRVGERQVCVRAVHGALSLTLTRPPPQPQPHTQQQGEAKEGRWYGTPRCCCHCRQVSPCHLLWRLWLALFLSDWLLYFHFFFFFSCPCTISCWIIFRGAVFSALVSFITGEITVCRG